MSALVVRMHSMASDAAKLADVLLDGAPEVRARLRDQIWLKVILVEQRKRLPVAERARFDARADRLLATLDPVAEVV